MPGSVALSSSPMSKRWVGTFKRLSVWGGVLLILIGLLFLFAWQSEIGIFTRVPPGLISTRPNSAAAFIFSGLALLLLHDHSKRFRSRLGQVCALLVTLIGLATTGEYLFGQDYAIDDLLLRKVELPQPLTLRMALSTALCFVVVGMALLLVDTAIGWIHSPAHWLAIGTLLFTNIVLLGYLYGIPSLYDIAAPSGMPLSTVIAFTVLTIAILFSRPEQGFMVLLSSDGAGGVLARRLLPGGVAIPFLLDWLGFQGVKAGLYDATFESAIHVVLVSVLLGILVLITSD